MRVHAYRRTIDNYFVAVHQGGVDGGVIYRPGPGSFLVTIRKAIPALLNTNCTALEAPPVPRTRALGGWLAGNGLLKNERSKPMMSVL